VLPKDVQALARTASAHGYAPKLLDAVEAVNESQKGICTNSSTPLRRGRGRRRARKTFAVWGLSFKPNTTTCARPRCRRLLAQLWEAGARVQAYDPEAKSEARRVFGERDDLVLCDSALAAVAGADALVVVTEWKQFRSPDFKQLASGLGDRVIFDGRNLYDPDEVEAAGLAYYGIGRGRSIAGHGYGAR
jgi:UDPglucose 6-dehydrogenase